MSEREGRGRETEREAEMRKGENRKYKRDRQSRAEAGTERKPEAAVQRTVREAEAREGRWTQ